MAGRARHHFSLGNRSRAAALALSVSSARLRSRTSGRWACPSYLEFETAHCEKRRFKALPEPRPTPQEGCRARDVVFWRKHDNRGPRRMTFQRFVAKGLGPDLVACGSD